LCQFPFPYNHNITYLFWMPQILYLFYLFWIKM
jgi:hypothetical protein